MKKKLKEIESVVCNKTKKTTIKVISLVIALILSIAISFQSTLPKRMGISQASHALATTLIYYHNGNYLSSINFKKF
jgi:hypothetical protein